MSLGTSPGVRPGAAGLGPRGVRLVGQAVARVTGGQKAATAAKGRFLEVHRMFTTAGT